MKGNLIWGDNEKECIEIASEQELDSAIDWLAEKASSDHPMSVELIMNSNSALIVVVGLEISSVSFCENNEMTKYYHSVGKGSSEQWITYYYRGHYSETPLNYFVPIQKARKALRMYFKTGAKPNNIDWTP